jgi:hypothetical protein
MFKCERLTRTQFPKFDTPKRTTDLLDLPQNVRDELTFTLAERIEDALAVGKCEGWVWVVGRLGVRLGSDLTYHANNTNT